MESVQKIRLGVGSKPSAKYVYAKQGDTESRFVEVTVCNGNTQIVPEEGATAKIRAKRPDGTVVQENAVINEDGTIKAEITHNMLQNKGMVKADIAIYGTSDETLSTEVFFIRVQEAPTA